MLSSSLFYGLPAIASSTIASPIIKRADAELTAGDKVVLQYALTLEHLENAFYTEALAKFDDAAFVAAGFDPLVRKRFLQIAQHEKEHVSFLSTVIGEEATQPCVYSFPYTDPKTFGDLAMVLEGVGVSAYTGAAQQIASKVVLTAAASILSTEARHASWIATAVTKSAPWSGPFDVPLDMSQVFSLAAPFITSCPATNPTLPVKQFPTLSVSPSVPIAGATVTLGFDVAIHEPLYLALFTGLDITFIPIESGLEVTLPPTLVGTVYGVVTTSATVVSDDTTVAGPVVLEFPDGL